MENIELKKLHNQYFEAIKQLQDKDDIISNLPKPEYESFFEIMLGLTSFIEKEIEKTHELIRNETEEELVEYYNEELEIWKFKLKTCKQLLEEANKTITIETLATVTPNKNLIFAKTTSGNIYLEKDLKDIPEEYYYSVLECLEQLKNGYEENNEEKGKSLKNNKKLAGIHEIKPFKIRVVYRNLSPDTIFIIIAKMKKSNNDKKDRDEMIVRSQQTDKEFEKLKKEIEDETKKQTLIDENNLIYNRLFKLIKEKGRG